MTALLPVESDAAALELDPVAYMTTVLHRAKSWLEEAQNIDDVRTTKAIAVGYENVLREKEMAFDAQLAATEIVRRCERRVGELVRQGQEDGTIRRQGQWPTSKVHGRDHELPSPLDFVNNSDELTRGAYPMAEASADQFNEAIEEAKAEGNLSRANVVRKVKGETKPEARSEWHHKKRHIDSNRIVRETARALDGSCAGLDLVDFGALDALERLEWIESLRNSLRVLNRFLKELSK